MDTILTIDDLTEEVYNEMQEYISQSIRNYESIIPISTMYIIVPEILFDIVENVLKNDIICYCYGARFTISGNYKTINDVQYIIASKLKVFYSESKEILDTNLNIINQKIDEILSPLKFTKSIIDRILYINDYFVINEYSVGEGYIYNILTNKTGFINCYTRLCKEIFDRLEIQNKYVKIDTNNDNATGEWLIVKIDEEWYHFGIGFKNVNNVSTIFFELNTYNLKSDSYMLNKIGYPTTTMLLNAPFEENISCENTKYDWLLNVGDEDE